MGAQAMRESGKKIEQICDALGHCPNSAVTRHYTGRSGIFQGTNVLRAKDINSLERERRITDTSLRPNPGMPRFLTDAEKENAQENSSKGRFRPS